jgi:Ion channel
MTRLFQISYSQKKTKRLNESRIYTVKSKRRQLRLLRNNQNLQGKSDLIKKSAKCLKALNLLQYEAFVAHKTAPFRDKINVISDSMKKVLTASGAQSEDELPPGQDAVKYAQLAVNLADVELQRTRTEADAREYGLHHLTDFQQQPAQKEYIAKHNELEVLREDIFEEQMSTVALRRDLDNALVDYRAASAARLGYFDFLYFSVGAATTATFGDISPNSTPVRMMVCWQVLWSIVFTGLMINGLAARHHKTSPN